VVVRVKRLLAVIRYRHGANRPRARRRVAISARLRWSSLAAARN